MNFREQQEMSVSIINIVRLQTIQYCARANADVESAREPRFGSHI
jgi:hypothetical protein